MVGGAVDVVGVAVGNVGGDFSIGSAGVTGRLLALAP